MLEYVRVYKSMLGYVRYVMVWYVRVWEAMKKVWKRLLRRDIISKQGMLWWVRVLCWGMSRYIRVLNQVCKVCMVCQFMLNYAWVVLRFIMVC